MGSVAYPLMMEEIMDKLMFDALLKYLETHPDKILELIDQAVVAGINYLKAKNAAASAIAPPTA